MQEEVDKGWSPYRAGALAGLVAILSVGVTGKFFGASTSFVRSVGMIEKLFSAARVTGIDYFVKITPRIDWQWMFVGGILIGSFLASTTSGSFRWQPLPKMWERRFGSSSTKRALAAFIGGLVALFGARLAGG